MSPQSASLVPGVCRNSSIALLIIILALFWSCHKTVSSTGDVIVRLEFPAPHANHTQTIPLMLVDEDPNIVFCLVKFDAEYQSQDELLAEFIRALAGHQVSQGVITRNESFIFRDVSPGRYWLVTSEPLVIEDERFVWTHPVNIGAGDRSEEIVLQRSNAAMVLDSENIIF